MEKIKLILADDHPLIREGFRSLLGRNEQFSIVGEAETGEELIGLVKTTACDIILVDINMPRLSGLDAMTAIRKLHPEIKFIVLTMHEEPEYVMTALRNGAGGYLLKNVERTDLERAINVVYEGGKHFSPRITSIIAESAVRPTSNNQPEITPREKEVLELVAEGHSTKQIADKLAISVRTVETHRINMLKKLEVNNSAELIRKAISTGILDMPQGKP
jgi:DNA-binding NarL/FixJ family response regulator